MPSSSRRRVRRISHSGQIIPWNAFVFLHVGQILGNDSQFPHTSPSTKANPSQPTVRHLYKSNLKQKNLERFAFPKISTDCSTILHFDSRPFFASSSFGQQSFHLRDRVSAMKRRIAQPSMIMVFFHPVRQIRVTASQRQGRIADQLVLASFCLKK